jgi:hypothetical protein
MTYNQSWQEIMDELQSEEHPLRTARAAVPVLTVHCGTLLNSQPEITASLSTQKCSDNAAESNKFLRNLTLAHGNVEGTKSLLQFCPGQKRRPLPVGGRRHHSLAERSVKSKPVWATHRVPSHCAKANQVTGLGVGIK